MYDNEIRTMISRFSIRNTKSLFKLSKAPTDDDCENSSVCESSFPLSPVAPMKSSLKIKTLSESLQRMSANSSLEERRVNFSNNVSVSPSEEDPDLEEALEHINSVYRLKPLGWFQLHELCEPEGDAETLPRSNLQEYQFNHFKRELRQKWRSADDFILCSKFQFEQKQAEDGKFYAYPSLEDFQETKMQVTAVLPEDFPYFVAENIEHFVLWKLGQPCTDFDIARAKHSIQCKMPNQIIDFICWEDPEKLESVSDIHHVQLLCLRRSPKN